MSFDFKETMKEATDAELIKIVFTEREYYQPAAVLAAEAELALRRLSADKIKVLVAVNEKQQQILGFNANIPLDTHWKVLTFILPGILQLFLSGLFRGDGYERKADELVKWTLWGFGF